MVCDIPDKSYVWNKIYKLNHLRSLGVTFEEGRIFEDVMFTCQILYKLKTLVTVPDVYYYYNRHSNSLVSRRDNKAIEDFVYAHKQEEEFLKLNNIDVSSHMTVTKRYRIFGLTIFKKQLCNGHSTYILFNIFKLRL